MRNTKQARPIGRFAYFMQPFLIVNIKIIIDKNNSGKDFSVVILLPKRRKFSSYDIVIF